MELGAYISYHAFTWRRAKNKFVKSILDAGGNILSEAKKDGKYLVKVSNPSHMMRDHPKWMDSNLKFWHNKFTASLFQS